jgi:hypothetical protein
MRALDGLEQKGAIRVTRRHGFSNRYDLSGLALLPVAESDQSQRATSRREQLLPVAESDSDQSRRTTPPVAESDPKEPKKEPRKEPMLKQSAREASTETGPRDWSKRPPTNADEALEMPLQDRAELMLRDAFRAQFLEPHKWPEVRLAVVAFRDAVRKPRLAVGTYSTDPAVRRLVELYAAGLTADEVCDAIPRVVASPWWTSGDSARDLGSVSLVVVRKALAERPAQMQTAAVLFGGGS